MASDIWRGLFRRVFRKWHESIRVVQAEDIKLQEMERNAIRHFAPDANARLGLTWDGESYRNHDSGAVYGAIGAAIRDPILEKLDAMHRLMIAAGPGGVTKTRQIAESTENVTRATWTSGQTLTAMMRRYDFQPRLHSILIGEYVDKNNTVQPLTLDIPKSVHVLNVGGSGLGKSTLEEAIAIQLSQLPNVRIAAIDYGSGTFDRLEPALFWQIADDPGLAVALLHELINLCNERKALYKKIGRIRSLDQYNAMTGDSLPFVPVLVDETSALLDSEAKAAGIREQFIELVRMGRKYGIGLILGGTDFKAVTLPTQARAHCQARIAFWMERALSQSLLNCGAASELGNVGDVVVKKPGVPGVIYGHTPDVVEGDYDQLDLGGHPKKIVPIEPSTPPTVDSIDDFNLDNDERVRRIVGAGFSLRAASIRVFGGDGGAAYRKAKAALE